MTRLVLAALAALGLAACVTNIEEKSAAACATLADRPEYFAQCMEGTRAELEAKNRRTAAIIAAGLGGAANTQPVQSGMQGTSGYLKREFTSGMNKVCVYSHLGSERYVNIGVTELCPLTSSQ